VRLADERHMTAKREPRKAALVLTDDDRAVLSSLPEDERAMVEDMMRRHAGRTAADALQSFAGNWDVFHGPNLVACEGIRPSPIIRGLEQNA
jgi:hypothetical protein